MAELGGEAVAELAAAFQQRTRRAPSTAAAEVRDAAALVAAARAQAARASGRSGVSGSGARDLRAALAAALSRARLDDGACGPAAIGPGGELARTPSVLEVQGDGARPRAMTTTATRGAAPRWRARRQALHSRNHERAGSRMTQGAGAGSPAVTPRDVAIHLGLFAACCATTWWFGGPYFAATLMGILLCHESGHYLAGRRRGVEASLPYFIPMPPGITFGTLGAVIRMRKPISDRNALFDVGAAGPVAGLAVAIPLLVVGLELSHLAPIAPGDDLEGNSILYALLKYAVFGRWLPSGGIDVQLHPMAFAGWVGLLITMINLMPIGQLDGGHVARAALGDAHEKWSARLHVALPALGLVIGGVMFARAWDAGRGVTGALLYAQYGVMPWVVWALLLGWMRRQAGEYHPPVDETPLDPRRRRYALAMLVIFFLIATPVPLRPPL